MDKKLQECRLFLKRKKITADYLVDFTGYSRSHISSVLNGKKNCTSQFYRLLLLALIHLFPTDAREINDFLSDKPTENERV